MRIYFHFHFFYCHYTLTNFILFSNTFFFSAITRKKFRNKLLLFSTWSKHMRKQHTPLVVVLFFLLSCLCYRSLFIQTTFTTCHSIIHRFFFFFILIHHVTLNGFIIWMLCVVLAFFFHCRVQEWLCIFFI